jgi:hypothetical protein
MHPCRQRFAETLGIIALFPDNAFFEALFGPGLSANETKIKRHRFGFFRSGGVLF